MSHVEVPPKYFMAKGTGIDLALLRRPQAVTLSARWQRGVAQAGLRYERLRFDDAGAPTALARVRPRAADVRARGVDGVVASVGVRFARWIGLLGEVSTDWYSEPTAAPAPGRTGPYLTAGLRLQIERP